MEGNRTCLTKLHRASFKFSRFYQGPIIRLARLAICLPMSFRTFSIANVVHFGETTKHLAEKMFSVTYHGLLVRLSRANKQKMRETGKCGNRFLGRKRCFPCYSVVYDGIGHGLRRRGGRLATSIIINKSFECVNEPLITRIKEIIYPYSKIDF